MSWLEEAQQIVKQKSSSVSEQFDPNVSNQREQLVKRLKMLYDNATEREIEKAIDQALEHFSLPYDEKTFMDFLRIKLED